MKSILAISAAVTIAAVAAGAEAPRSDISAAVLNVGADIQSAPDVAAAIQAIIDANPNRTIFLPDGTYILSRPIVTAADPKLAVSLHLSDFAILKAAEDFPVRKPLVRLGGSHPANNIRIPGSVDALAGGILDGSGIAAGVTIESGRETRIRDLSMKNVAFGLRILRGANNGSSDCDIRDVNIVGNRTPDSVGVIIEAHDNTLTNLRIADCRVGVRIRGGGNRLTNVHPLWTNPKDQYPGGIGFDDGSSNNSYICCYADHFSTGWRFRKGSGIAVLQQCINFWYAPTPGQRHTAIRCDGQFRAHCSSMEIGFNGTNAVNTVLAVGAPGGDGSSPTRTFTRGFSTTPPTPSATTCAAASTAQSSRSRGQSSASRPFPRRPRYSAKPWSAMTAGFRTAWRWESVAE